MPGPSPSRRAARPDAAEALRRAPLLRALPEAALAGLVAASVLQTVPKGTTLVAQGEAVRALHIVVTGSVGLRAITEDGNATLLGIARPGEPVLLHALLLDTAADASAETLTAAQLLAIPVAAFRAALAAEPALTAAAMRIVAEQCRALSEQLVDVKARSAEERLIRFLDGRAVANDDRAGQAAPRTMPGELPVEMPEPRGAIALRLGMTPESLSRFIGGLERRGVIRQNAGRLSLVRGTPSAERRVA